MPKLKSKKTLLKRIRITKNNKVIQKQNNNGHLKIKKSSSNKHKKDRRVTQTTKGYIKVFSRMLAENGKKLIKGNRQWPE